jgi:hypothetical protein
VALLCLAAGVGFFLGLERLWPLAQVDLVAPRAALESRARLFLEGRGFDLRDYRAAVGLVVDTPALDYTESSFGREQTQEWIAGGLPLTYYRVDLKRRGERTSYVVSVHPAAGVLGWRQRLEEDAPGARVDLDRAREIARDALREGLGLDPAAFEERSAASAEQVDRRDHSFRFERWISRDPELRERVEVVVSGDSATAAVRGLRVPASARRAARSAEAPAIALEVLGFLALGVSALAAFFVFLRRLQTGSVRLGRALIWPGVVFVCLMGTYALETPSLFRYWETLWPKSVSDLQYLGFRAMEGLLLSLVLLTVVAAGDALDREGTVERGAGLWRLARGRGLDPLVVRASRRGFLVGLLCGGVMAAAIVVLQATSGAHTSIQPRGFFFYTLNTAAPALTTVLFFLGVAFTEELGYRFFFGTWLLSWTRRRFIAIVVPAVVYGLTHTRLDFLPPAEPWWGRALVLTLVGCVWGWAFFRYDALTVVLSHFTADLFIFNWPRLASGSTGPVLVAAATIAVPLIPAVLGLLADPWRRAVRE